MEQSQETQNGAPSPEQTNMNAGKPAGIKNMVATVPRVRIRAKEPIRLKDERTLSPGQEAEVDEEEAKEFCDKKFDNSYSFAGEVTDKLANTMRNKIQRAERVGPVA
jgi:hypothetical protein